MVCVSESGLYKMVMRSYKPEARAFRPLHAADVSVYQMNTKGRPSR